MKRVNLINVFIVICILQFVFTFKINSQEINKQTAWETLSTKGICKARHENSFVAAGNQFYLLGGRGIKPINIFNPTTKTWFEGAAPPVEIHHFQGVSYKGKIYVIGAMTGKYPYEKPLSHILVYNPKEDKWGQGAEIPESRRRGSSGVVVKGTKAYILSGIVDGHNSTHVPWVDTYNFKTQTWEILANAPRSRDHFHAAIKNDEIYCAGGRNSSFATNQTFELTIPEVDVYNLKTNTWSTLKEKNNIPTMRAGASSVFVNNNLIVIGGESVSQKNAHNTVEAFNIKSKSWTNVTTLNQERHGTQAIVYKNAIYISAGSGNRGGKPELNSIEKFLLR